MSDYAPASVLDFRFSTILDAVPTTLAGTPVVSVYKDNSTTQSTSGVTLSVDFDGLTGSHNVRVDTSSDGTFYAGGSSFQVVVTAGTVGGKSLVGFVVDQFTLSRATAIANVTKIAGQTASAAAGVTFPASIGTSTFASGGSVNATQWGGVNVTGMPMPTYVQPTGFLAATFPTGTVANTTNITAGTIATVTTLTNLPAVPTDWLTAAGVKSDAVTKIQAGLSTYAGGAVASVTGSVGGVVGLTVANLDASVSSRMATYAQPSGFLSATFPSVVSSFAGGAVASVAGSVGSVTSPVAITGAAETAGTRLLTTLELSGSAYRFTTLSLANAPTGSGGPTASQIAIAVVDQTLAGHTTTGTVGGALVAAGSSGDPLATVLPGPYMGSQAGSILFSVYTRTGSQVTVVSPVSANGIRLTLVKGDDYVDSDGRALVFSSTAWPDVSSASIEFWVAGKKVCDGEPLSASSVTVDVDKAITSALIPNYPAPACGGTPNTSFSVRAVLPNNDVVTLTIGSIDILNP